MFINFKRKSELQKEFVKDVQAIRLDTELVLAEMGYDKKRRKEIMGAVYVIA